MKKELLKIDAPELQVIEKSKAEKIKQTFEPMVKMLEGFEDSYSDLIKESEKGITRDIGEKAKRLRIDIGKVRIETGKLKDAEKAEYLRAGKAIQGVHNILVWAVTDKENKLKVIEDYFIIQERERLEKLQIERVELLNPYIEDASERDLSSMDEDVWAAYFGTKKKEYEDRIAAEKKAEADRIAKEKAEALERERIKKENERLQKEAIEREKREKAEREKREKEEAKRKELEEIERKKQQAIREKEQNEYEAKLKAEREKRDKIEAELKSKAEQEEKEKEAEKLRIESELNKGDSEKVKDLILDLENIKSKYSFKSKKNIKMYSDVGLLIDKVINHITK